MSAPSPRRGGCRTHLTIGHDPTHRPAGGRAVGDGHAVDYRAAVPRADFDVEAAVPAVQRICDDVRIRGVDAIREFSAQFDGVADDDIRVPATGPRRRPRAHLDPDVRAALEESIARLRATCAAELEQRRDHRGGPRRRA